MKTILMFCEPRTGSKILCDAMGMWSPMKVLWDFLSPDATLLQRVMGDRRLEELRRRCQSDSISSLMELMHEGPGTVFSQLMDLYRSNLAVKIHACHLGSSEEELERLVALPFTEVIVLKRQDSLRQYVSWLKAFTTGHWDIEDITDVRVTVDPGEYDRFTRQTSRWYDIVEGACARNGKQPLVLGYETHLMDINMDHAPFVGAAEPWFARTGIDLRRNGYLPCLIRRQDLSKTESSVINWEEIKDIIAG